MVILKLDFENAFHSIEHDTILKVLERIGFNSTWIDLVQRILIVQLTRSYIQDCIASAFEYIHQCQQSKRELVFLKLDFEKAFDSIEHDTILKVLERIGFSSTWIDWVQRIFDSATILVLLNGIPGTQFQCKRGVRQGGSLSPLLFVLAANLL